MYGLHASAFVIVLIVWPGVAAAQSPCTAPPRAPADARATLEPPVAAAAGRPFTPAVLTLTWKVNGGAATFPQTFVVEAGSQPGTSDIGTSTTAGAELTFSIPVANGTHYLRVRGVNGCGTGAPSRDIRLAVTGSAQPGTPNPAVLLGTVHGTGERLGADAFVRVMGQVRNGWNAAPAALVTVRASYEGARGELGVVQSTFVNGAPGLLRTSRLVTDTILTPGGTGCFVLFARFGRAAVTGLELVAGNAVEGATPFTDPVTIDDATLAQDGFGSLVVSGDVANRGDTAVADTYIWSEARDLQGRVLDCRGTPAGAGAALASRRAFAFSQVTEAPFAQVRVARWWPAWSTAETEALANTHQAYRSAREALQRLVNAGDAAAPEQVAAARDAVRVELKALETGRR